MSDPDQSTTVWLPQNPALYLNLINGHELGGGQPVYTGPGFVLQENAELVQELAANGTR